MDVLVKDAARSVAKKTATTVLGQLVRHLDRLGLGGYKHRQVQEALRTIQKAIQDA